MQPGTLGGIQRTGEIQNKNDLLKLLNYDVAATNGTILTKTSKYAICPSNTYKVALVYDTVSCDYHWYRQNSDGTWSHKPGRKPVTNLDDDGNPILDPQSAAKSYNTFVGFYYVEAFDVITPYSERITQQIPISKEYPNDFQ